jgi:hypothetical protein
MKGAPEDALARHGAWRAGVSTGIDARLADLIRVTSRPGRGFPFEALFTEGVRGRERKRPPFEREREPEREPEPAETGHGPPDDAIGHGSPMMEKASDASARRLRPERA